MSSGSFDYVKESEEVNLSVGNENINGRVKTRNLRVSLPVLGKV